MQRIIQAAALMFFVLLAGSSFAFLMHIDSISDGWFFLLAAAVFFGVGRIGAWLEKESARRKVRGKIERLQIEKPISVANIWNGSSLENECGDPARRTQL